jgi:L-fuculose-phosphate aldolase
MNFNLLHPRDQIISMMDRIYRREMTTVSGGNISIMDESKNIWITPKGIDKGNLNPKDIVCVRKDGSVDGPHAPSSEFQSHRMIYESRGDVGAIVHTHSPSLMAYSISENPLDPRIHPHVYRICGPIGFVPYALMGTELLGENISKVFADGFFCVLLENHCAFCVGTHLMEAFRRMEALETCARIMINAKSIGDIQLLSEEQLEKYEDIERPLPEFQVQDYTSDEHRLRQKIVTVVHRAYARYLMNASEGVVSARLGPQQILITPQDCDRDNLSIADIVLVDNGKREKGKMPDKSATFHEKIYAENPDIGCIITAQPPFATAFALTGVDLDTTTIPESYVILRRIQRVPFDAHIRSKEDTARKLSHNTPVLLIENDCVLTTGRDPFQAFDRLEVLDFTARTLLFAARIGRIKPLGDQRLSELDRLISEG